jgi:hypothetical protein
MQTNQRVGLSITVLQYLDKENYVKGNYT